MKYSNSWQNVFDLSEFNHLQDFGALDLSRLKRYEWVPLNGIKCLEEAYMKYSPLAAVIMRMAEMFANGKFEVLNRATQNYTRGQYKDWDNLLANPNFLQTRSEFLMQLYSYVAINGWCYAMPMYPSGITDRPYAIFLLPPWLVTVEAVKLPPHSIKKGSKFRKIWICWGNKREEIDESKLILFKDTNAILDATTYLPKSRIENLQIPISNGIGAGQSRNSLIHDRGASGILANSASDVHGAIPIMDDEVERLEKLYRNRYGFTPDKTSSVIISSAALKWQPMTFNVKDLMLHEEHALCIKDICDIYGYQYRLLSTGEGATYANAKQDNQNVYYNAIVPRSEAIMEQLNTGLRTPEANIELAMTYGHVPDLQQSEKEKGEGMQAMNQALETMFKNGLITRNMWLERLGLDTVKNPVFDKYIFEMTPEERGILNLNNDNDGEEEDAKSGQGSAEGK